MQTIVRLVVVFVLVTAFAACSNPAPVDNAQLDAARIAAAEKAAAEEKKAAEESLQKLREELEAGRLKRIKELFAFSLAKESEEMKARATNDVLCDAYLRTLNMESAFEENGVIKAGLQENDAREAHEQAALHFGTLLSTIILKSAQEREALEKEWDHTCDGMLEPTDQRELVRVLTTVFRAANLVSEDFNSPRIRTFLLAYYQKLLKDAKDDEEFNSVALEALYWFTPQQLSPQQEDKRLLIVEARRRS